MNRWPRANAFFWFLLFCGLLEIGARVFLTPEGMVSLDRNETQLRNWPEYLAGNEDHNNLMVYLSNSQAVGLEIKDSSSIYPSLLRDKLRLEHPDLWLENWSVSGLSAEHIELLTIKAAQRNAKTLVLAVSMINFDSLRNYQFTSDVTDIQLLVGIPSAWHALTNTFMGSYLSWEDKLSRLFLMISHAARGKIVALDLLAEMMPSKWHRTAFGQIRNQDALKTIRQMAPDEIDMAQENVQKLTNPMSASMWKKSFQLSNAPRLQAVYEHLRVRLIDHGIKLVWIWTPVGRNEDNLAAVQGQQDIIDAHCQRVIEDGWACEDLSQALDASFFIPSIFSSHLTPQGHQAEAALIYPILNNALH
ncbi:MAG: hypothetical protein V3V09_08140 [Arenicellales bacterium]